MNTFFQNDFAASARDDQVELSVVLPVFNESAVLGILYERLQAVLLPLGIRHELLFVDDGSQDGSTGAILRLAQDDPCVTAVILDCHAGKEAALTAGLSQASGQAVIIMDADLQDPPECIPDMLMAWRAGADVVRMCREPGPSTGGRGFGAGAGMRRFLSTLAKWGGHGPNTDFMLYSRKAVAALNLVVQRKRYMDPMFAWMGFRESRIAYQRRPRAGGASRWRLSRLLGLMRDEIADPVDAGLQLMMALAVVIAGWGLLYGGGAVVLKNLTDSPVGASPIQAGMQAMIWAAALFSAGWVGRVFRRMCVDARRPAYTIRALKRS